MASRVAATSTRVAAAIKHLAGALVVEYCSATGTGSADITGGSGGESVLSSGPGTAGPQLSSKLRAGAGIRTARRCPLLVIAKLCPFLFHLL